MYNEEAINTTVIMHNMIIELCKNSSVENGLTLGETMSQQINEIKEFNKKIYIKIQDWKRLKNILHLY